MHKLFNNYADQAEYFDLCLLIYHTADYRNTETIHSTWENLIQQIHEEVAGAEELQDQAAGALPKPYEAVSSKIQNIAHRTSLDSFVFPISTLLPEVCRYSFLHGQDGRIGADPTWPVQLFLALGVSHDMIVRVLGHILDMQSYGFSGGSRARIIELVHYAVESWVAEIRRRGGGSGSVPLSANVDELLESCETTLSSLSPNSNPGGADPAVLRIVIREVRREVNSVAEAAPMGSLRYY